MMKTRVFALLLMCLILTSLVGCGNKQTPPPASDTVIAETVGSTADVTSATDTSDDITAATTESKVSESTTAEKEEETKPTESTTPSATSAPAESTQKPVQTAKPTENPPKTAETTTPPKETEKPTEKPPVKPTEPPVTESAETHPPETKPAQTEPKPTEPAETEPQGFTKADHDRIIAEVKAYAESYTAKGYTYIWKAGMEFSEDVGYMGTPRIKRDGVDGAIRTLKHHIDLIYKTTTDPSNGITCDEMTYRVMQIDLDGEIAFVVVYGG